MLLLTASEALDRWIETEHFRGWDPYDALKSPLLNRLTFGQRRIGQVWVQLVKHSPLNLRALLGIPKVHNPKGMGLFLASYLRKFILTQESGYLEQTRSIATWLVENSSSAAGGRAWGYPFPWPNRGFFAPAGTPNVINTTFIGLAFVDLCSLGPDLGAPFSALDIARQAAEFVISGLHRLHVGPDEFCFSYTPLDQRAIHNANLMAAWLLAEVGQLTQETELKETALKAARFSARRQAADGSWLYGPCLRDHWVDNFHTGFVLQAFAGLRKALNCDEFKGVEARGYAFWKQTFLLPDGTPKYYAHKTYPIDIHAAAQAVLTLLTYRDQDPAADALARKILGWSVKNMRDPDGYFYFQRKRGYTIRIPYMRWSQAWMQRAFSEWAWVSRQQIQDNQEDNEDLD